VKIDKKLLIEWEERFPDLDALWTHWWLEGDGFCLGVIACENLSEAIATVKNNHVRFTKIFAYRARIDTEGQTIRQDASYEIFRSPNAIH
jgi:hypothetical protein